MKKLIIKIAVAIVLVACTLAISMNCKTNTYAYIIEEDVLYIVELDNNRNVIESTKKECNHSIILPSNAPINEYFVLLFNDVDHTTYKWSYL